MKIYTVYMTFASPDLKYIGKLDTSVEYETYLKEGSVEVIAYNEDEAKKLAYNKSSEIKWNNGYSIIDTDVMVEAIVPDEVVKLFQEIKYAQDNNRNQSGYEMELNKLGYGWNPFKAEIFKIWQEVK